MTLKFQKHLVIPECFSEENIPPMVEKANEVDKGKDAHSDYSKSSYCVSIYLVSFILHFN